MRLEELLTFLVEAYFLSKKQYQKTFSHYLRLDLNYHLSIPPQHHFSSNFIVTDPRVIRIHNLLVEVGYLN
jgi:hypothetical protein